MRSGDYDAVIGGKSENFSWDTKAAKAFFDYLCRPSRPKQPEMTEKEQTKP